MYPMYNATRSVFNITERPAPRQSLATAMPDGRRSIVASPASQSQESKHRRHQGLAEHITLVFAGIGLLSLAAQWLAWRTRLPAIVFLLLSGIAIGPLSGWFDPDVVFGEMLLPVISLSVAIILFEGSLSLKFGELAGVARVVRNMLTIGTLAQVAVTIPATHWLIGFSWELSLLFGVIMIVTGPTVVMPMLRAVRPAASVANTLKWEGILIDPIGALLAVLVFEYIAASGSAGAAEHGLWLFGRSIGVGLGLGAAAGYLFGLLLRNGALPDYLENVASFCLVLAVFVASNLMQAESGLLAVTVMGLWLANMRGVDTQDILDFKESISLLLVSGVFIILAARMELTRFADIGWSALLLLLVFQFLARPAKILLSALGSDLNWRERLIISWIGPRGIVAAAVASIFALRLEQLGDPQAPLLVTLTFAIIIGTVFLQSFTARPLAGLLGVSQPDSNGWLLIGGNPVARAIGKALQDAGYKVILADRAWQNVKATRMEGLTAYYGSPISKRAERYLDLTGIGHVMGLSPQADLNSLISSHFRSEFGRANVYSIATVTPDEQERHQASDRHRGATPFGDKVNYALLASRVAQGAQVRSTRLSEQYAFEQFMADNPETIPLFTIDPRGRLHVFGSESTPVPGADWNVLSLAPQGPAASTDNRPAT